MSTGLHYLDLGIGVAVFACMLWWMFTLTIRPRAERKQKLVAARIDRQPWGADKAGGRGNR